MSVEESASEKNGDIKKREKEHSFNKGLSPSPASHSLSEILPARKTPSPGRRKTFPTASARPATTSATPSSGRGRNFLLQPAPSQPPHASRLFPSDAGTGHAEAVLGSASRGMLEKGRLVILRSIKPGVRRRLIKIVAVRRIHVFNDPGQLHAAIQGLGKAHQRKRQV